MLPVEPLPQLAYAAFGQSISHINSHIKYLISLGRSGGGRTRTRTLDPLIKSNQVTSRADRTHKSNRRTTLYRAMCNISSIGRFLLNYICDTPITRTDEHH